jgi:hypothetical protein
VKGFPDDDMADVRNKYLWQAAGCVIGREPQLYFSSEIGSSKSDKT